MAKKRTKVGCTNSEDILYALENVFGDLKQFAKTLEEADEDSHNVARFLFGLIELRAQKGKDYGSKNDTFKNYNFTGDVFNMPGYMIAATRIVEKAQRLGNLLSKDGDPANESVEDTLRDLALISAIVHAMLLKEENENPHNE